MKVRAYEEADLEALRKIHASQGFGYSFPDLSDPIFLAKLVLADEKGIGGAALLRLTAEAYLLIDPAEGSPRERWGNILALHDGMEREAWGRGLQDVHAWLPPEIAGKFGRRLKRLGWVRDDSWTPYCKRLG